MRRLCIANASDERKGEIVPATNPDYDEASAGEGRREGSHPRVGVGQRRAGDDVASINNQRRGTARISMLGKAVSAERSAKGGRPKFGTRAAVIECDASIIGQPQNGQWLEGSAGRPRRSGTECCI